jgi:hypothetical protein
MDKVQKPSDTEYKVIVDGQYVSHLIYMSFQELFFLCGLFYHDANISYYRVLNSRMVNSEFERIGKEIAVV